MKSTEKIIKNFIQQLQQHFNNELKLAYKENVLKITDGKQKLTLSFFKEKPHTNSLQKKHKHLLYLAVDLLITKEKQILFMIQSKLQRNKKVFARKCLIKKINHTDSISFLNQYHIMGYAKAAYNVGVFFNTELLAVATFSKGRKMNRLNQQQRSFELIRFCCKEGLTITGGLSRVLNFFVNEKKPGDIMTYIDKQFSEGKSYLNCGFKIHSETVKHYFLINKKNAERIYYKESEFKTKDFYLTENCGNLKLVYTLENQQI